MAEKQRRVKRTTAVERVLIRIRLVTFRPGGNLNVNGYIVLMGSPL